jgi:HTH-type transcriptional regulator/antitoxin HigA
MQAVLEPFDIQGLQQSWVAFDQMAHLRPIHNAAEYDRTVSLMHALLDVVGDAETHPLTGLLELVSDLVGSYDEAHYAIEASEPKEVLRYLLETKNLSQSDLAAIVAQSNLSAILAGKRKISATLAGKLAGFFNVSPAVFITLGA